MSVAAAAPDQLCGVGLICQPAAAEPPLCPVVAIQVCQQLIGTAEVLNSLPIGPGNTGVSIETRTLDVVAPDSVSRRLKHVGPCPGMVCDIAGLMLVEGGCTGIRFR